MMFPKNHILHMKGLVPKNNCKKIINYFESHSELQFEGYSGSYIDFNKKKDTEILGDFKKCDGVYWISKYLHDAASEYVKCFPSSELLTKWNLHHVFKIQRYYPNEGYFKLHFENPGLVSEPNISDRVLAWMIYLNDVSDGGYTEFPDQRKRYQPRTGDTLLWPAYFTHPHRGITSKTQTKYIVTGWFNFIS